MEMTIEFPGGARVDAHFDPYTVHTDQPPSGGGEGSAPTPFSLFLASIGTCAGIYVLDFCRQRNLPTENIRIVQRIHRDATTGMVGRIDLVSGVMLPVVGALDDAAVLGFGVYLFLELCPAHIVQEHVRILSSNLDVIEQPDEDVIDAEVVDLPDDEK